MKADIQIVATILNGLLASGHYTFPGDDDDGPKPAKFDNGKDYKEYVSRRFTTAAVEDSFEIYDEILDEIDRREMSDKEV